MIVEVYGPDAWVAGAVAELEKAGHYQSVTLSDAPDAVVLHRLARRPDYMRAGYWVGRGVPAYFVCPRKKYQPGTDALGFKHVTDVPHLLGRMAYRAGHARRVGE